MLGLTFRVASSEAEEQATLAEAKATGGRGIIALNPLPKRRGSCPSSVAALQKRDLVKWVV